MKKSYAVEPRSIGKTSQRYGSMFAQKSCIYVFCKKRELCNSFRRIIMRKSQWFLSQIY